MNILVPTDFSEIANTALQYAVMLAKKLKAKILLFHAIPHHSVWWALANDEMVAEAKQKQQKIKDMLLKLGVNEDKIELHVFYQFPLNIWINDFIRKNKIDFVVIGTKGTTGLKNGMIGSFALGMIDHAAVPIIAVPPEANVKDISHILYPTDLKDSSKEVKKLIRFSKTFGAFLHIVHVSDTEMAGKLANYKQLSKIAVKRGFKQMTTEIKTGSDIQAVIKESIQEKNADLLAMFPQERGFFKKLFTGSVTEEMSVQITIPLLAIRKK